MDTLDMGTLIRQARETAGLTQFALARAIGLESGQAISDVERGRRSLSPKHFGICEQVLLMQSGTLYGVWMAQVERNRMGAMQ